MDSYHNFKIRPATEDTLSWVRFFCITVVNHKFFRWARIFILVLDLIIFFSNIYFYLINFNSVFFFTYLGSTLQIGAALIYNICLFWIEGEIKKIDEIVLRMLWSADCTTKEAEINVRKIIKFAKIFIYVNCFFGMVCGFMIYPLGKEQEYEFAIFFFREYFPNFHYIFEVIYFITFPIAMYMVVNLSSIVGYYTFHMIAQLELTIPLVKYLTAGYDDQEEEVLLHSLEYQETVKRRGTFLAIRHIEFLAGNRLSVDLVIAVAPWIAISGIAAGLKLICNFILYDQDYYWKFARNLFSTFTLGTCGLLIMHSGQQLENQTSALADLIFHINWLSFGKAIKQDTLIMMHMGQQVIGLHCTRDVTINYNLGIKMLKYVYSFVAVFAQIREILN